MDNLSLIEKQAREESNHDEGNFNAVAKALSATLDLLESPSISDDDLPLFLQCVWTSLLMCTLKDRQELDEVADQFEEAVATACSIETMKFATQLKGSKFPQYPNRQVMIGNFRDVQKYWQTLQELMIAA
jgi:hypothetical protein